MITMEAWIQILNNTIAKFGSLLPDEAITNLQRVRDEMEREEARSVSLDNLNAIGSNIPEARRRKFDELLRQSNAERAHLTAFTDETKANDYIP